VAAAITNVGMNVLNLREVWKALKLSPYNRSYLKLLPPVAAVVAATVLVSRFSIILRSDLAVTVAALILAYGVFVAAVLAMGLDADDRLIQDAIWARVRLVFGR
jgi:hypothetical protein